MNKKLNGGKNTFILLNEVNFPFLLKFKGRRYPVDFNVMTG